MERQTNIIIYIIASCIFIFASCEPFTGERETLVESLNTIEKVSPIPGGQNASISVNNNAESYFRIGLSGVNTNDIIENGYKEGWCIDWTKSINSNKGTYEGIKLYSTYLVENWKPINYLLNIKEELIANDPNLTWQEIQLAIWNLRENPQFNLNQIDIQDLPSEMHSNGEPNFSYEKVSKVVDIVSNNYEEYNFTKGTKFAVIAETPEDVQTIIIVAE